MKTYYSPNVAGESVGVRRATNLRAVKMGSESYRLPKCIKHTADYYTCNENTIMFDLPFVVIAFVRQIAKFMLFY